MDSARCTNYIYRIVVHIPQDSSTRHDMIPHCNVLQYPLQVACAFLNKVLYDTWYHTTSHHITTQKDTYDAAHYEASIRCNLIQTDVHTIKTHVVLLPHIPSSPFHPICMGLRRSERTRKTLGLAKGGRNMVQTKSDPWSSLTAHPASSTPQRALDKHMRVKYSSRSQFRALRMPARQPGYDLRLAMRAIANSPWPWPLMRATHWPWLGGGAGASRVCGGEAHPHSDAHIHKHTNTHTNSTTLKAEKKSFNVECRVALTTVSEKRTTDRMHTRGFSTLPNVEEKKGWRARNNPTNNTNKAQLACWPLYKVATARDHPPSRLGSLAQVLYKVATTRDHPPPCLGSLAQVH